MARTVFPQPPWPIRKTIGKRAACSRNLPGGGPSESVPGEMIEILNNFCNSRSFPVLRAVFPGAPNAALWRRVGPPSTLSATPG